MPTPKSGTEAVERLSLLLSVLTADWQDRDAIIERAAIYPEEHAIALRMFPRDMRSLLALGFQVERSEGHHDPQWRLVGHARFGQEVPCKYCSRCAQWRPLDAFTSDKHRSSGKMIYCRYCNVNLGSQWYQDNKEQVHAKQRAWRRKFPERERAKQRRYYVRHKEARKEEGRKKRRDAGVRRPDSALADRNRRIAEQRAAGKKLRELAEEYGLTIQRVGQICRKEARKS